MKQAITYKDIALSLGKVISLEELSIRQSPNCHGELCLSAILDSKEEEMAFYDMPEKITVTYKQEGSQRILFKGLIRESSMKQVGEYMEVKLTAYDATYILDTAQKTRSFQNTSRTSHSVLEEVTAGYSGCICMKNIPNEKIGQIWFQYEETDWEFLCRFASHYGEQVYADATYKNARFQAGASAERIEVDWENYPYRIGKDFKQYAYLSQNGFSDLEPNAFLQYVVESYELYTLGSRLAYKGGEWIIASLARVLREGILVCTYILKRKAAMQVPKKYNRRITGISTDGKVVQIHRDKVRVRLNVDTSKEQGSYWFPFSTMAATSDGSGWYSMPQKGDSIRIYFPTRDEKEGYAITKHDSYTPAPKAQETSLIAGSAGGGARSGGELPSSSGSSGGCSGTAPEEGYGGGDTATGLQSYPSEVLEATDTGGMADTEAEREKKEKENPMDDPEKRNIFTQDGNMVRLAPTGVFLSAGSTRVSLYKNGAIAFYAPGGITLNAGKQLYVNGANITLEAKNIIKIDQEQGVDINIIKPWIRLKAKEIHEN